MDSLLALFRRHFRKRRRGRHRGATPPNVWFISDLFLEVEAFDEPSSGSPLCFPPVRPFRMRTRNGAASGQGSARAAAARGVEITDVRRAVG